MEEKFYAEINVVFDMDINENSLFVKLKESDIRKIFRAAKKFINNLSVEFNMAEMEMVTFDIFVDDTAHIKIINNQIYIFKNGIIEILIDENDLVRDIILEKALNKNYDDISKVMQLIYPNHREQRKKSTYRLRESGSKTLINKKHKHK